MANVLVLDPSDDVRDLYGWTVAQLGHRIVVDPEAEGGVDAIIMEPASPAAVSAARSATAGRSHIPIIYASIEPRATVPGLSPVVYLVKPFPLRELEAVLARVLP